MNNHTIEVIISPQGEVRLETQGFAGSACRQASQFLEQALGVATREQLTAEFHQQAAAQSHVQQGDAR